MTLIGATILLLTSPAPVPQAALKALQQQYPGYAVRRLSAVVSGDLDGDGREDWTCLVQNQRGWAILIAYNKEDGWRAGNIDIGAEVEGPTSLALLPAGRYERDPSCLGALAPNERPSFSSRLPGIVAIGWNGSRRAYQLGPHAWGFVCLGNEHP